MKRFLLLFFLPIFVFFNEGVAQNANIDFSGKADTTVTLEDFERNSPDCNGATSNCIVFTIKLNANADLLNFEIKNPAPPGNAAFYTLNCDGIQRSLGTPICITGNSTVTITYCKTGADEPDYIFTSSTAVKASADLNLRQLCTGAMSVTGLQAATITWTSIFPGTPGQYDSYLSSPTGSLSTNVTPAVGAPAYILYKVSGNTNCTLNRSDTVRVNTYAPMSVALTPTSPVICAAGGSITLTATPTGGNAPYSYLWSNGATTQSITVTSAGNYSVQVSDNTTGCGPITQSVTVTAAPTPSPPAATGASICSGSTATVAVTTPVPGETYRWYSAASGGTLLFTGTSYTTPVLSNTTIYYVDVTSAAGCTSSRTAVTVTVNPIPVAPIAAPASTCNGSSATLSATAVAGVMHRWYTAATGGTLLFTGDNYTTPALTSNTIYYVDATSASGCTGPRKAVEVTILPTPAAPTASSASICSGTAANLSASAVSGGFYEWYDAAAGGNLLITGLTYTTPVLNMTTTYYVQVTVNGCTSARRAVTVTVNPIPVAPTVSNQTICYATTATLSATAVAGITHRWYTAASGGTLLFTGDTYITPNLTSGTTYYVDATSASGCTGPRAAVAVTVNPLTPAPTVSGVTICNGSTATLTATAPGGTYDWYDSASGGTILGSGANFTTPVLTATAIYYVQATVNGCTGARAAVTVTVTPTPATPTAAGATICSGSSTILTATAPGGTYDWYDSASGGTLIGSGANFTTPVLTSTTTYYVQTTVNGCVSARRAVTVTVIPAPAAPTAPGVTVCEGDAATLTATTVPGETYRWYSAASGGTLLFTGATYNTPNLFTTTTYYVDATSAAGCTGPRTAVTVSVTLRANPAFTYRSGTYCKTALTNPTPNFVSSSSGTFSGSPGLAINPTTGEIDLGATPVGTYDITFTVTTALCSYSSSQKITITNAPDATFSYATSYCQFQTNPLPTFPPGASAGVFSSSAGLVFLNASTGEIDLQLSTPGPYTITNTIGGAGDPSGCAPVSATYSIVINPRPTITSTASDVICSGATPNYTITSNVSGTTFTWSRAAIAGINGGSGVTGTGNITETLTNTTINPVTVVYNIIPTAIGCDGPAFTYTVTVNPTPTINSAPTQVICNNTAQNYTITSNVPGTTFTWSRAAVAGISNGTINGQTSSTITETLTNTTNAPISVVYTIVPSANGCGGPAFTYTVTVNPTPNIISTASATTCNNTAQNYNITSNVIGATFSWSRPAVAGISNGAVSGHTSSTITETLTNTTNAPINVLYTIVPSANGCDGPAFTYTVTVNPTPNIVSAASATICNNTAQNYNITSNVIGATFSWSRPAVAGISNLAVSGQTNSTITETLTNTTNAPINVVYTIIPTANGCDGPAFTYTVTVNPTPNITSAANAVICNDIVQNYSITSAVPGATFGWSRAAVTGISNLAVSGQASSTITETLTNTTNAPINVVYTIIASANGCDGPAFTYTVTVNPTPNIISAANAIICSNVAQNYAIQSNVGTATFSWARPAVAGISNLAVSGQNSSTITETLINTTNVPINVVYTIIPTANGCPGTPFTYTVTVNPTPTINSAPTQVICNNTAQNYTITSNVPGTTFTWSRAAVAGISNGTISGQTSSTITETLINTTINPVSVVYNIIPTANGCDGPAFTYTVTVNPTPTITNSSLSQTVCSESSSAAVTFTSNVSGVAMQWTATASSNISGFAASGTGNLPSQTLINVATIAGTIDYLVTPYINGCPGTPVHYIITVNPKPATPVVSSNSPVCENYALTLTTPTIPGATYLWTGPNGFTSPQQNPVINSTQLSAAGVYSLVITVNGCSSDAGTVNVTVLPTPAAPVAFSNGPLCAGNTLVLTANTIAGATYNWTGPNGFTSNLQNPSITNITTAGGGVYSVTVTVNGCTSAAATTTVIVTAIPAAPVATTNGPVCEGSAINLSVNNIPGTTYTWTGPNGFTSNLPNPIIPAASQANAGVYTVTATVGNCTGPPTSVTVNVNQTPVNPVASSSSPVCPGDPIMLSVSTFAGAIYHWTGPNGFSSNLQNPVINNASTANAGIYTVSVTAPGCSVTALASIVVVVKPTPVAPTVSSNSPVCIGDNLNLTASNIAGAIYSWVGPNGFTSGLRNPVINNASVATSGIYSVTVTVDGCTSAATTTNVVISVPKIAFAGNNQVVCANSPIVTLTGTVTNDNTGIWVSSGTGTFSPSNTSLSAIYIPSVTDIAAGNVTLTLSSVNNGGCGTSSSSIQVTITPTPIVNAGGNKSICDNDPFASLTGSVTYATGGKWTTSGTGSFSPSANAVNATYMPSEADKARGSVILTLTSVGNNCFTTSDEMTLTIIPSPIISMPDTKYVLQGESAVLNPGVLGSNLQYSWSPATNLSSATIRNPVVTGVTSQLYTLSVTGAGGCIVQKQIMVNVLKPIVIPNTFTPNGDGINDRWVIKEFENYPGAQLSIFNRYGTILYHANGNYVPWDGNYNGQPVPFGTYYYLIELGKYGQRMSGYIVVVR